MEGNGPIQGTPKRAGVLVMGHDLVAVDATCCRIMGIDPEKVEYLRLAATLGHVHTGRIEQRGESIASVHTNFALIDEFSHLRLASFSWRRQSCLRPPFKRPFAPLRGATA